ncbi:hypothetical protein HDU93_003682 [Gonapodya sp. JEL0774]|nr:hypothetical protein HDU93_003682 [Gonapodya sp. JEL0774]
MRDSMQLRDAIWTEVARLAGFPLPAHGGSFDFNTYDLNQKRVAILFPPSYENVVAMTATLASGGAIVPLSPSYPLAELEYFVSDSEPSVFIVHSSLVAKITPIIDRIRSGDLLPQARGKVALVEMPDVVQEAKRDGVDREEPKMVWRFVDVDDTRDCLFIYTSVDQKPTRRAWGGARGDADCFGTPYRADSFHPNINLPEPRERTLFSIPIYRPLLYQRLLHVLPLHHGNGILICLWGPLCCSSQVEFAHPFSPAAVWNRIVNGNPHRNGARDITVFAGVPTIISRLLQYYEDKVPEAEREEARKAWERLKVVTSGSAALPDNQFNAFKRITGHEVLERYGYVAHLHVLLGVDIRVCEGPEDVQLLEISPEAFQSRSTELGVVLSVPLPGVEIRLWDHATNKPVPESAVDVPGEIQVKGSSKFSYYWKRPDASKEFWLEDGWAKTGDVGARMPNGYFKILGRESTDIIKTGGYKVSALESEREVLDHPNVESCAVFGLPDDDFGERVALVVVPKGGVQAGRRSGNLTLKHMRAFLKERLAAYKVPSRLLLLEESEMPRTALGKVQKRDLRVIFKDRVNEIDSDM